MHELAAEISNNLRSSLRWHGAEGNKNILITGWPRIGKSTIAKRLARRHGYTVLSADRIRGAFWHLDDDELRSRIRAELYVDLLRVFPNNVVFEGDDFLCNRHRDYSPPLDLSLVARIRDEGLAACFLIGCADEPWQSKFQGIERHRQDNEHCYTNNVSEEQRLIYAKSIVEGSARLRQVAGEQGFTYIELDSNDFAASILRATQQIEAECPIETAANAESIAGLRARLKKTARALLGARSASS